MKKYIYKIAYYGYEGSWSFLMKHTNKYNDKELQEILNGILENYKLLIALKFIEEENSMNNFIFMYDLYAKEGNIHNRFSKCRLLSEYSKHIEEILIENYGFESYAVKVEAEASVSEMNDEDF